MIKWASLSNQAHRIKWTSQTRNKSRNISISFGASRNLHTFPRPLTAISESARPVIYEANQRAPAFSKIYKEMIIVTDRNKPLPRTPKGTVMRALALRAYATEIEERHVLYLYYMWYIHLPNAQLHRCRIHARWRASRTASSVGSRLSCPVAPSSGPRAVSWDGHLDYQEPV